jgi:hypothetical protein
MLVPYTKLNLLYRCRAPTGCRRVSTNTAKYTL